jgi:hypothetical protein
MEWRAQLRGIEPLWRELIEGPEICRAAGLKDERHFVERHYCEPTITRIEVGKGVWSCWGSSPARAHYYVVQVAGERHTCTIVASAAAGRENVRVSQRARLAAVRWLRHYTDVSPGAVLGPAGAPRSSRP